VPASGQKGGLSDELQPYVDRAEVDRFDRVGEFLRTQRPAPAPNLLDRLAAGPEGSLPPRFRQQVVIAFLVGLLLLALALLGSSGSGPLGG
jgi:hypothetical protein